ncbi:MAG: hypothetical protein DRI90_04415 [Deltaproteobacteria bacterium]|nr:MAG: hypothetical protein DRI90_04415 [Deltaproteobacteria bacterium]
MAVNALGRTRRLACPTLPTAWNDTVNWEPFDLCAPGQRPPRPRDIGRLEGLGDRLRTAAFAELQAVHAFTWAVSRFEDLPEGLGEDWRRQIPQEERHCALILERMAELGIEVGAVPVSPRIWESVRDCQTGKQFCLYIASAEERGRQAGIRLCRALQDTDPKTCAIFQSIVDDEEAHVALAATYYGWHP